MRGLGKKKVYLKGTDLAARMGCFVCTVTDCFQARAGLWFGLDYKREAMTSHETEVSFFTSTDLLHSCNDDLQSTPNRSPECNKIVRRAIKANLNLWSHSDQTESLHNNVPVTLHLCYAITSVVK